MAPLNVSVCIIAHNETRYISACVDSVLQQTFRDFEIIIVDDYSTDSTTDIIARFKENNIRYFRNSKNLGVAKSRNRCVEESKGRYLFFTDADCTAAENWIEEGVKALEKDSFDGVEGKIIYVAEDYRPTIADNVQRNERPGKFMGGNIAYRKEVVESARGFDEKYTRLSDRKLGLEITRNGGRVCFSPNMIVYHARDVWSINSFVRSGSIIGSRVHLFKEFGDKEDIWWRVVSPRSLVAVLCPPSIILSPIINSYKTWEDFRLFPFIYFRALYGRLSVWRECIRDRVFLI